MDPSRDGRANVFDCFPCRSGTGGRGEVEGGIVIKEAEEVEEEVVERRSRREERGELVVRLGYKSGTHITCCYT